LAWTIKLSEKAKKNLAKLDPPQARLITRFLHDRIGPSDDPRQYGISLSGNLATLWRYRVGDYRIVCELKDDELIVLVVRIGHRRDIYR